MNENKETEEKINGNVISFLNMKGGVSKTTLCKELGMFLALKKNKRVLFVDIDPQANLTQSLFKRYGYKQEEVISETFEIESGSDASDILDTKESSENRDNSETKHTSKITNTSIENMVNSGDVKKVSRDQVILDLEENISIIPGCLGIDFTTRNLNSSELEGSLFTFIKDKNLKEDYHFIFIDCPPTYSSYTTLALKASEAFLIPVRPEAYSILGIKMLLKVVEYILEVHDVYFQNKSLRNLGIVFTNIKKRPSIGIDSLLSQIRSSSVIKSWNVDIFDTNFEYNSQIPKDISYDIATSNSEISLQNLDALADEFLNRLEVSEDE